MVLIVNGKSEESAKLEEIEKKIDELKVNDEKIIELIKSGEIKFEAHLARILENVDLGLDSYDKIMNILIEYGKKKGLRK